MPSIQVGAWTTSSLARAGFRLTFGGRFVAGVAFTGRSLWLAHRDCISEGSDIGKGVSRWRPIVGWVR